MRIVRFLLSTVVTKENGERCMGWLDVFKKKTQAAAEPAEGREAAESGAKPTGQSADDHLEAEIRRSMHENRQPVAQSADIRQTRNTRWGPARPYWVIDSTGFRRSFSQLAYGTDLRLQIHGEGGEHGRAGRIRVTRDDKTVGYLSGGTSRRYLPVVQLAETIDAHLTVEGVVAEYHGKISLTVFLPAPDRIEGVIRDAVAAASAKE